MKLLQYFRVERLLSQGCEYSLYRYLKENKNVLNGFNFITLSYILERISEVTDDLDFVVEAALRVAKTKYQKVEVLSYFDRDGFHRECQALLCQSKSEVLKFNGKTLIHVHVPKSAGTSFNASVANHFYRNGLESIPGNDCKNVLRYYFRFGIGKIPFIATGHIPLPFLIELDELKNIKKETTFVLVKRDKRSRLNSIRNQLLMSLISGNYFNRPWAYRVHIRTVDFFNKYLFPFENEALVNGVSHCAYNSQYEYMSYAKNHINVIDISELEYWVWKQYNIPLLRLKKNKTLNISKFLPGIPVSDDY